MVNLLKRISYLTLLIAFACNQPQSTTKAEPKSETDDKKKFKFWVWMGDDQKKSDAQYDSIFSSLSNNGIKAVLINTGGNPENLKRYIPLAEKKNLEVHAWYMTMNRPGDEIALENPDWYAVSREGKSCFDTRPYVGYYQWLCPNNEDARSHILNTIKGLSQVQGVASVHLDYIRFVDIFLPVGLQPKYELDQTYEMPEFDFCYCDHCIKMFEKTHHKNPRESDRPDLDLEWKQFRLNSVKRIVDDAYAIVHENNTQLTAAVFPYPTMAEQMVRQRWDKWNIDEVLPMIYHNFYNEEIDWIGYATKQGVQDLAEKKVKLNTGLFVPSLTPEELKEALQLAKSNGASGVGLFGLNALSPEHLEVIKTFQ